MWDSKTFCIPEAKGLKMSYSDSIEKTQDRRTCPVVSLLA